MGVASNRAVHDIVRACYVDGDDPAALRKRLVARLRRAVPIDATFVATADPDSLLFTSAWADEPLIASGPLFLENEFGSAQDVNQFAALARAPVAVASLDAATRGAWNSSRRWREIMAPLGLGDELRVALRSGASTWGFLCLHREGRTPFSAADLELVRRIAPHAGEALRRIAAASMTNDGPAEDDRTGVVLVAHDNVIALTEQAASWLELLGLSGAAAGAALPLPLLAVVRRLHALERGEPLGAAAITLPTRAGSLIRIHATRLYAADATGPVALTIAAAGARARSSLRISAYALTPAQRRVAELVLQGRSTRQIVRELHVSEYTVQDHLKRVFDLVGVGSRRELVAHLLR